MPYIVVPFRLDSQRVPRKVLADLQGEALCVRVLNRVLDALVLSPLNSQWTLIAAVDSVETRKIIEKSLGLLNLKVILTDPILPSGTDRVFAAIKSYAEQNSIEIDPSEIIVNIQGDMPLLSPLHTSEFLDWCLKIKPEFGTLAHTWPEDQAVHDVGHVKVITNSNSEAIYFSRFAIPYSRMPLMEDEHVIPLYHVGMYAFKLNTLEKFCSLEPSPIEKAEGLEQLRALANAQPIKVFEFQNSDIESSFRGIDTPSDMEWALSQTYV